MLRETKRLEEEVQSRGPATPGPASGLRGQCYRHDEQHASLSEVAHEADAVTKVLMALLNQYGDKVLVGLQRYARVSQMLQRHAACRWLRMREANLRTRRQLSTRHTVQVVGTLALRSRISVPIGHGGGCISRRSFIRMWTSSNPTKTRTVKQDHSPPW
jgi:hypothetical protein